MKNFSLVLFILLAILLVTSAISSGSEALTFPLAENKMITALRTETDPAKKEALVQDVTNKCPFKDANSDLSALTTNAITLNLSASLPDKKKAECDTYLQGFNDSMTKAKGMQLMIKNTPTLTDSATNLNVESNLQNALVATSGLRLMLQSQCEFDNNSKDIATLGNQLINVVEQGSSALMLINPMAALAGAGAAATGRLVISIGDWLFQEHPNQLGAEASDSERFINDLCSFRLLAQKYDKFYTDPFEDNLNKDKGSEKVPVDENKIKMLEDLQKRQACVDQAKSGIDKLQLLSQELATSLDKPSSQKQCLTLLGNYAESKRKPGAGPLYILASSYKCSESSSTGATGENMEGEAYCKNLNVVDSMTDGNIYDKCESEEFQKNVFAKFTNLSDIVFRNAQEKIKDLAPTIDELQKIREAEIKNKEAQQKMEAVQAIVDMNPISNTNTLKSMTNLGRNLLGFRFDGFASTSLQSANDNFEDIKDALEDLVDRKEEMDGNKLFSWGKKNDQEKSAIQQEICKNLWPIKRQLANVYRLNVGVKDVCDFMKGDGIPPLKSKGLNYDDYSASLSDKKNRLSNRCGDIYEKVTSNFTKIKEQVAIATTLGCNM